MMKRGGEREGSRGGCSERGRDREVSRGGWRERIRV